VQIKGEEEERSDCDERAFPKDQCIPISATIHCASCSLRSLFIQSLKHFIRNNPCSRSSRAFNLLVALECGTKVACTRNVCISGGDDLPVIVAHPEMERIPRQSRLHYVRADMFDMQRKELDVDTYRLNDIPIQLPLQIPALILLVLASQNPGLP
jgi:hypothetical protein